MVTMADIDRIYARPFEWGVSDCVTRACDVAKLSIGIDLIEPVRGRYDSAVSAARIIASYGGWRAACALFAARSGYVAGVDVPFQSLGLVPGDHLEFALAVATPDGWAAPLENGVVFVPEAALFWGPV